MKDFVTEFKILLDEDYNYIDDINKLHEKL